MLALLEIVDDFFQPRRQLIEGVVQEVKLKYVRIKEVRAKLDALVDYVDVLLVKGGHPDVIFVREAHLKVAGAAAAVPHVMVVLSVLAKDGGEVVLRE